MIHPDTNIRSCDDSHEYSQRTREVFAQSSIRCTKPRMIIYESLCATTSHPTAEELHNRVKESQPGISLATIYNTLELLVDHGLARRISNRSSGSGPNRYDADQSPHIHLVLEDGRVLDAPDDLGRELVNAIPKSLMDKLAAHAGVSSLKIEMIEDSPTHNRHHH